MNIRINEFVFRCHRVILASASEFFDSMFKTSIEYEISLEDVDFQTFDLILNFIYSGTIVITDEIVVKLFITTEYLGIPSIEKVCLSYLMDHTTAENAVDVLNFAYKTGKRVLVILACEIVAKNFTHLYQINKLLSNNSEVLTIIFSDKGLDFNFDAVLEFLAKWVKINRNREKYLTMLLKQIVPREFPISIYCLRNLLLSEFQPERVCEEQNHPNIVDDYSFILNFNCDLNLCAYHEDEYVWKFYKLDKLKWMNRSDEDIENFPECRRPNGLINGTITDCRRQFVYSNRELYTLLCLKNCSSYVMSFYTVAPSGEHMFLKSPSEISPDFSLTMMEFSSEFYLYFKYLNENQDCRVHRYDCNVNNWFPVVSTMNSSVQKTDGACVTVLNNILYVLDGQEAGEGNISAGKFYDTRCDKWYSLPPKKFRRIDAACCAYAGKLYVSGGYFHSSEENQLDVFDPIAGKWSYFEPSKTIRKNHTLVPFETNLWEIGGSSLCVDIYNPKTHIWSSGPSLENTDYEFDLKKTFVKHAYVSYIC